MVPIFLAETKTLLREAFQRTFDADYPVEEFRPLGALSSLEGPVKDTDIPMVWVDFQPATELTAAGIGHVEYGDPDENGRVRRFTRWRFTGFATFTFITLNSQERDRMVDEFVRVVAFGLEDPSTATFRRHIEDNDLIGISMNWHRVALTGRSESQGTPWGTGEWVYEQTVQLEVANGEFVSEGSSGVLVPLSSIQIIPVAPGETDPVPDFLDQSHDPVLPGEQPSPWL